MFGQRAAHLTEIPALNQGQAVLDHFTALPQTNQVLGGHAGRHAVLTAVQRLTFKVKAPVKTQPEGIVQGVVRLKTIERSRRCCTGRNVEQLLLGQVEGLLQRRIELPGTGAQQQACQHQTGLQQQQEFTFHESDIQ